jgi:hypothetical protein
MVQISEKMLDKYYCTERRYYHPEIDDTRYSDMEYSNTEQSNSDNSDNSDIDSNIEDL